MSERVSIKHLAAEVGLDIRTVKSHLAAADVPVFPDKSVERATALTAINARIDPAMEVGQALANRGNVANSKPLSALSDAKAESVSCPRFFWTRICRPRTNRGNSSS